MFSFTFVRNKNKTKTVYLPEQNITDFSFTTFFLQERENWNWKKSKKLHFSLKSDWWDACRAPVKIPGVAFTNVLWATFSSEDTKTAKRQALTGCKKLGPTKLENFHKILSTGD